MRCRILRAVLLGLVAIAAEDGVAERYPAQPVRLVVPQAPGGQADVIARLVAQRLGEMLRQPVVVVNHGGVGGTIGADLAAKAPADGYTLLLGGSNNLALAKVLRPDLPYDPVRDFVAIRAVARVPYGLAVNPKLPVRTLGELLDYARARPGRLNYGSGGTGSTSSLGVRMLEAAAALDIVEVPYGGSAPAVTALVAGQVDLAIVDLALLIPHARTGALRLLAAAGARRAATAPELPTIAEQGFPGYRLDAWYAIVAPAGTPAEALTTLRNALSEMLRAPDFRQRLERLGYDPADENAAGLEALIRADIDKYSALVERGNIKAAK